ncbi:MAG TPA: non-canonical purine NTP pyrophosphatase [Candidatus Dormibacteraeota bacterium]
MALGGRPTPLVLATRNPGKVAEFARLLAPYPWQLLDLDAAGVSGELAEPGPGYAENAAAKADAVCAMSGLCALGDDSGIEVIALRGWPGPHSARWRPGSDADRLEGLLLKVAECCPGDRRARYVAAVALARPGGAPALVAMGNCRGRLVVPRGRGGFGYDPGFLSDDLGRTFGEVATPEKDAVSHRARAVAELAAQGALGPRAASRGAGPPPTA